MPDNRDRDPYAAAKKATSIAPTDDDGWVDWLGKLMTESTVNPLVNMAAGEDLYGEDPGPVDLILAATGVGGVGNLLKKGYKKLLDPPGVMPDKAIKSISSDPYGLRKGKMDRRNFLWQASTKPEKNAREELVSMFNPDEALGNLPEVKNLDAAMDAHWKAPRAPDRFEKQGDTTIQYISPAPDFSPEDVKVAQEAAKKYTDKMATARRINKRYKYISPSQMTGHGDGREASDVANQLSMVLYDKPEYMPPKLEDAYNRAVDTDMSMADLSSGMWDDMERRGLPTNKGIDPNILKRGGQIKYDYESDTITDKFMRMAKRAAKHKVSDEGSKVIRDLLKRFGVK